MSHIRNKMEEYYNNFSGEYPCYKYEGNSDAQNEVAQLKAKLSTLFTGRRVIEIACGTGYWTNIVSKTAKHILATDQSDKMLDACKNYVKKSNVTLMNCDAYDLSSIHDTFDGGMANFWFSHIPKQKIELFLASFHKKLVPGAGVYFADSNQLGDYRGEPVPSHSGKDNLVIRTLQNGSRYEIVKNYYNKKELREIFSFYAYKLDIFVGKCFWSVYYELRS